MQSSTTLICNPELGSAQGLMSRASTQHIISHSVSRPDPFSYRTGKTFAWDTSSDSNPNTWAVTCRTCN
ncbi:hypothetical protein NA56DRAFT_229424 [Hyaloscypha hepaticicola]|uniref:Uncharacterized protein n=1 Tax=Hyaloscypha hepaticicola TaxID=2082293 RepID=A0A2J6QLX2_9HELO|nr:hypothetical protein NA56DRAFT_229424 [Hyaloscypha hepaticicola]